MLSCRNVTHLVATDQIEEAGWWVRLSFRLHIAMCRHCRRYVAQIKAIGEAARALAPSHPEDPETLRRLGRSILEQIPSKEPDGDGGP